MSSRDILLAASGAQTGGPTDPYFYDVSLLLNGDGVANGSQNNTFIAANGAAQGPFADPAGYWSVQFDGNGDYLTVPDNAALRPPNGDFTYEIWWYPTSVGGTQEIFTKGTGVQIYLSGGVISCALSSDNTGSYFIAASFGTPTLNAWNHIALVRSGTNYYGYLNGARTTLGTSASYPGTGTDNVVIGAYAAGQFPTFGYLSNARYTTSAVYTTSPATVPTSPLTAISGTQLLTCQSNVICDTSSNLFAITANGNAAVNNKSPFTISSTYNPYSFSGYFDGAGDYLSLGTVASGGPLDLSTATFTLEAWVYLNSLTSADDRDVIASSTATVVTNSNVDWVLRVTSGGYAALVTCSGNNGLAVTSATQLTVGWNHIAATRTSNSATVYVNGVGTTGTVYATTNTNRVVQIGQLGNIYSFAGYISNARVVKGSAVYTSNFTPSNEPLTAISGTSLLTCQSATFVDNSPNNFTITVNGNTTVATASNSGLPITRNGNTTQGTFSPYGNLWSNYFDGSGDYLTLPTGQTPLLLGNSDFTFEAWVYRTSGTGTATILAGQADLNTGSGSSYVFYTSSTTSSDLYISSSGYGITSPNVPLNTWSHVAWARTGGTFSSYLNGVRVGTRSDLGTLSVNAGATTWPASLGAFSNGNSTLNGYISNARLIKGSGGYNATQTTITVPTTPLTAVSGTSLLTCQSNRFKDNSSNNFTLTVNGNTSVQRFSPFNPTAPYSASTIGGSGYFDGSGDYLTSPSSANVTMGSGDFTIELWAYPLAAPAPYWTCIISIGSTTTAGREIRISQGQSNYGTLGVLYPDNSNTGDNYPNSGYVLPLKTWTHIALCRSGTNLYLFANGNVIGSYSSVSFNQSATAYVNIANNPFNDPMFNGYISNVRVIKGTAVYPSAFTPPTSPVTAVSGTSLLCNFTNAGIPDAAMQNDLETVGNAQVSTSVVKYGTGSIYLDGTGDWLYAPPNTLAQMGTGNFTIEGWFYAAASPSYWTTLISLCLSTAQGHEIRVSYGGSTQGGLFGFLYPNSTNNGDLFATVSTNPSLNTWHHFALVRNSTTMTLYINGTSAATASGVGFNHDGNIVYVGANPYADPRWNGYIDDLRITKGLARYTANFTPPTAALPVY